MKLSILQQNPIHNLVKLRQKDQNFFGVLKTALGKQIFVEVSMEGCDHNGEAEGSGRVAADFTDWLGVGLMYFIILFLYNY